MKILEAGPESSPELNAMIGDFVCGVIWGEPGRIPDFASLGVFDGDQLIAGVLYHNWYPETGVIELTSASISKRWLARPVLNAMFSLPFDRWNCQLCALRVSERNTGMISIAERFGFKSYRIPRLRGRDEAEIIFTLTDEDWRAHPSYRSGSSKGDVL